MTPLRHTSEPAVAGEPRRPRRADARRNYDALLTAATEVFGEQGVDAPLDEIARRAHVGNATMYRHFPTRQELILAVYADEVRLLREHGEQRLAEDVPADALFTWLRAFVTHVASKRFLTAGLSGERHEQPTALVDRWHRTMRDTAAALLRRAQQAGTIVPDVDAGDLLVLANGIALTAGDTDHADRLLAMIRYGMDTGSATRP